MKKFLFMLIFLLHPFAVWAFEVEIDISTQSGEEPLEVEAKAIVKTGGAANFHWDMGDGKKYDKQSLSHTYQMSGNYEIKLVVKDKEGNVAAKTVSVEVKGKPVGCATQ